MTARLPAAAALAATLAVAGCGGGSDDQRRGPRAGESAGRAAPPAPVPHQGRAVIVRRTEGNGAVRTVARREGFLTRPSRLGPRRVVLRFVHRHVGALGLSDADLRGLELVRAYRSGSGTAHLLWTQTYRGIPAVDGELRASVTADGRLIALAGVPTPDLEPATTTPRLDEGDARAVAAQAVSALPSGAVRASLAVFGTPGAARLAWRVLVLAPAGGFDVLVDALDGRALRVHSLSVDATALVHDDFPGAPGGGAQVLRTLGASWLTDANRLLGPNAWVFADPADSYDDFVSPAPASADEIPPSGTGTWSYTRDQRPPGVGQTCPAVGCTWDQGNAGFSWTVNRNQAGTQLFWFVNRFHDYLRDDPGIGFGAASGAMEGADPVFAQLDDGATTAGAFPDCDHVNNASMTVPPDGYSPILETFLWTSACGEAGVRDVNGADDAYVVYHEYTHGLSFRLVTDAGGVGTLLGNQSGAMGEGISDWYAKDYLVAAGLEADTSAPGEVLAGTYLGADLRSQAFDCPVNAPSEACPGSAGAGSGGYTYGDFAKVLGFPEVHADGEIWVETLWDLRRALVAAHGAAGATRARALITDGMRLAPAYPTFLDLRDAILQAERVHAYGDRDLVWGVFAARGMGLNAATDGDSDTTPTEDFSVPPPLPPVSGPPTGPLSPPVADQTSPVVLRFRMRAARFRVGPRSTPLSSRRRVPVGSAFSFRLNEPADVAIAIARALPGRRAGRSCRRPSRRLRRHRRCTRYKAVARLKRRGRPAGRSVVAFSGRLSGRALAASRYRAALYATDPSGNHSRRALARFTVVPSRRAAGA